MIAVALTRASDDEVQKQERGYIRAALEQFGVEARQIAFILARAEAGDIYVQAALDRIMRDYAPGGDYHVQWLGRYTKLIQQTVEVGGKQVAASVGFDFNLQNPRVLSVIRQRAGNMVQHVTDTTKESIRAAVELGRSQGQGVKDIAQLINESTFGEITKARAKTIARTEVVGAMNAGEYQSALQSGVLRSKTWLTQGDERVRPGEHPRPGAADHRVLDGKTIDIRAAFANGLLHPHAPGAPAAEVVNCRCTLTYSDEEAL